MLYAYEPFDLMVMQTVELMDENDKLKLENAKLRDAVNYLYGFAKTLGVDEDDMRELGIEVNE